MTPQEEANLALVRRFREEWPRGREKYLAPSFVAHRVGFAILAAVTGKQFSHEAIPDRHDKIEHIIASGDWVWATWRFEGTYAAELFGVPPTGKPVSVWEMGIFRIADGKIVEGWFYADELGFLHQAGAWLPASG